MYTCTLCSKVTAIKQSPCCKRDTTNRDALLNLSRLHLLQQATERQRAENAKNIYLDSNNNNNNH